VSLQAIETARSAIRHTLSVYNNCGDRGRIQELLSAFAPDALLQVPGDEYRGHAQILEYLSGVATGTMKIDLRGARHNLTTSRIEIDGPENAHGWTYFFVMRQSEVIQEGTYIDQFIRSGDRWLISHRRVKMLFSI
jgi:hypothetical protein